MYDSFSVDDMSRRIYAAGLCMENKSGNTFYTFFFLLEKALPQLHFVLIMKSEFVFIMT